MSSDRIAELAATIEVLTGTVHFLLAERVAAQPAAIQGDLLAILQRSLAAVPSTDQTLGGSGAVAQDDLARWMPIAAAGIVDGARRQLGLRPEGVLTEEPASEVAEGCRCERAARPVGTGEGGRAAA
jgi:hypothetical protein